MYRLAWRSLITGFMGHGQWLKSDAGLSVAVESLNLKYKGEIAHWIKKTDGKGDNQY